MTQSSPPYSLSRRWMTAVMACFHPYFNPGSFYYEITSPNTLQLKCATWGDIGQLIFKDSQPEESSLRIIPPAPVPLETALEFRELIDNSKFGFRLRMAEMSSEKDLTAQICEQTLLEIRLARHGEVKTWLDSRLRIFGYNIFAKRYAPEMIESLDESFDLPLQSSPALFAVMIQGFIQSLHRQPDFKQLNIQLALPGGRKDIGSLPSDANPVEIHLKHGKNQYSLQASTVPSGESRLHVHMEGSKDPWKLWDEIRDELVRLGWFTFPEVPEVQTTSAAAQPEPATEIQAQPQAPEVGKWMFIPEVGVNREIVRLFYQGYTYRQIGDRVDRDEETINKKISLLRKEHGEDIVPYRRSKPTKKAKNDQEDPGRDISGTSSEYLGT